MNHMELVECLTLAVPEHVQKVEKKEPKMIVEMLKFDKEEKKEEIIKKEEHPFFLKEVKTP